MVKDKGSCEELSEDVVLIQKLMENARKMEEYVEEKEEVGERDTKTSKPVTNKKPNRFLLSKKNGKQVSSASMF
nr:ABC transporter C family member 2-like [Tanacetum cinerariifolium]